MNKKAYQSPATTIVEIGMTSMIATSVLSVSDSGTDDAGITSGNANEHRNSWGNLWE